MLTYKTIYSVTVFCFFISTRVRYDLYIVPRHSNSIFTIPQMAHDQFEQRRSIHSSEAIYAIIGCIDLMSDVGSGCICIRMLNSLQRRAVIDGVIDVTVSARKQSLGSSI